MGALFGIILTPGYSPAAQLRYDTSSQVDYGEQFQRVLDTIRNTNVNVEAVQSEAELFNIAIDAILNKIGDTHGGYYNAEEYRNRDVHKYVLAPEEFVEKVADVNGLFVVDKAIVVIS